MYGFCHFEKKYIVSFYKRNNAVFDVSDLLLCIASLTQLLKPRMICKKSFLRS